MIRNKKFVGISDEHIHNDGSKGYDYHTLAGKEHLSSELTEWMQKRGKLKKRGRA